MQNSRLDNKRLAGIDTARGLAIVLVVIFHYMHNRILDGVTNAIVGPFGLGGVTLFFMLSGFLIERHLARDTNPLRYFSRRLFRILPAYLVCLVIVLAVERAVPTGQHWSPRDVVVNAALLQDILGAPLMLGVIWTLLIEIKFYALAPLIKRGGPITVTLAPYVTVAANLLILLMRGEASTLLTYLTFCLVGMQIGPWSRGEISTRVIIVLVAVVACATSLFSAYFATGLALFVVLDAAILALAVKQPISLPPLPFLGTVSYSWYLYHAAIGYPVIGIMTAMLSETAGGIPIAVAVATATSLIAAWLSYMTIERPMIAFGHRCERYLRLRQ